MSLLLAIPWPGRSGHEISLQVQRIVVPLPPGPAQPNPNEGLALLQTSLQRKKTLSLDELIPEELSSTDHWIPFQLLHLDFIPELPREIFLEEDATEQEVEQELQKFGHHRHAYAIGSTGKICHCADPFGTPRIIMRFTGRPMRPMQMMLYCIQRLNKWMTCLTCDFYIHVVS